jgi:hypothetical protein
MYALSAPIAVSSFLLTRGTDGIWWMVWAFPIIAIIYTVLVWLSRADRIGFHLLAFAVVFPASAALGALPPPHLEELAILLYYFLAAAVLVILVLGAIAYFAGWLSRLMSGVVNYLRKETDE